MPRIPYTRSIIEMALSDQVVNDTRIKRKARFLDLHHNQNELSGESRASITVLVTMFAADAEIFGPILTGPGFRPYRVELSADNNTWINTADGSIVAVRQMQTETEWLALADNSEDVLMLQGDFFEEMRDNGLPGTIRQMIEHHIAQADALGKFA